MKSCIRRVLAFVVVSFVVASTRAQAPESLPPDERPGGLTANEILQVIRSNMAAVQRCFEVALERRPDLEGTVVIHDFISADGTVQRSEVASSTVGDAEVGACIARECATWVYPRPQPPGVVSVRFPFRLSLDETPPNRAPAAAPTPPKP